MGSRLTPKPSRSWNNKKRWNPLEDPPKTANQRAIVAGINAEHDNCIPWPGNTSADGYGVHGTWTAEGKRTTVSAHRYVLELTAGPPPVEGMQAAHRPVTCHNRACINRRHLKWKTPQENSDDKVTDGTANIKLTDAQAVAIILDDRPQADIARDFGVTQAAVSQIKSGARRRRANLMARKSA